MEHTCKDCCQLSPRDVFTGVCLLQKQKVLLDQKACKHFTALAKCELCAFYKEPRVFEFLGECNGELVYPDLAGCENFCRVE